MKKEPLISIITPTYNPSAYIIELYHALKEQTFKHFEWIIIDDFSSNVKWLDKLRQLNSKGHLNIRIERNKSNLKQAISKNQGVKISKGKFLKFIDDDDLINSNHIKNLFLCTQKLDQNKIAFVPTANFKENIKNIEINDSYQKVNSNSIDQLKRFIVKPFFHHCGILLPKKTFNQINGFDTKLVTDEDGDFIIRLLLAGFSFKLASLDYYYYRHHNGSRVSINDNSDKWESRKSVIQKTYNSFPKLNKELAQKSLQYCLELHSQSNLSTSKEFEILAKKLDKNVYFINPLMKHFQKIFGIRGTLIFYKWLKKIKLL